MENRYNYSTPSTWEPVVGYSRAVRMGNFIAVSGTTAANPDGTVVGGNDPYLQTQEILQRIKTALEACDAHLEDVIRTRIFVCDISQWEHIARAHGEMFRKILPAATMVQVSALIADNLLVEIEADAIMS